MTKLRLCALTLALAAILAASASCAKTVNDAQPPQTAETVGRATQSAPALSADVTVADVDENGNVILSLSGRELFAAGFAYGDVVTITIGGREFEMPVCDSENEVLQRKPLLRVIVNEETGRDEAALVLSYDSFFDNYRLSDGIKGEKTAVKMLTPGGYAAEWAKRSLKRSDIREDYPALDDEGFANFRAVSVTGIGAGVLYRSSSPVNGSYGRSVYADEACRKAGIRSVVNMTDDEKAMRGYAGYAQTFYAGLNIHAEELETDFSKEHFKEGVARALRFMIGNEAPFLVHCMEGKDRTGFLCGVLEALAGAGAEEIVADYMLSYYNFFGVEKSDARYAILAQSNIKTTLADAFGMERIDEGDLKAGAKRYLAAIGLTDNEIAALENKLAG